MMEHMQTRELISAIADGEARGEAFARGMDLVAREPAALEAWQAYHLIGDVLRSEDLAADPSRDAVFLQRLRVHLAQEPAVFAPGAVAGAAAGASTRSGTRSMNRASGSPWRAAFAVAAGFVAVAGVYTFMQPMGQTPSHEPALASAPRPEVARPEAPRLVSNDVAAPAPAEAVSVASGKLLRDARLDAYLAAHEQFAGSTALGMPSAFLRSATVSAPGR